MTDASPATEPPPTPFVTGRARVVPRASLVLLAVALPLFFALGLPLEGWLVAAGLWVVSTTMNVWVRSTAAGSTPNAAIGLAAAAMFARMGISIAALLYVGVSVRVDDTTFGMGQPDVAAVALVLYTLVFTLDMGERIGSDVSARRTAAATSGEEGT